jgi:TetR/AcrR family transcriptional repressor of nem operon
MRVSQKEMEKSHGRIVKRAASLFRKRGIAGTSVADVMSEAGLTHGGFYRHFETKEKLAATAVGSAFDELVESLEKRFESSEPGAAVADFHAHYLSKGHLEHPEVGCPAAALGSEVAREKDYVKSKFGCGVNRVITELARGMPGTKQEKRDGAVREFAMLAGAVMIARASDPETAREVLSACRRSW